MAFWGVSNAARVRYRNQSTSLCRTQVGHIASLAKKSIAYTLRSYPSANLWNPKLKAGVTEVHWSVEIQQPIPYLCLIPQLSKSMVQPHCCCRLTLAEINGFRAGRCVWWRPPSLHEILFILYDVHLHFLLFTCFFWKILSYLTQIHQIQNVLHLWKWKDLSAVSRKFFWSVEIEQPLLVAKLTRAEIYKWPCSLSLCGGRRSSMKSSSFHVMSISTSCSSHVSFKISCHTWPKFIKFKT